MQCSGPVGILPRVSIPGVFPKFFHGNCSWRSGLAKHQYHVEKCRPWPLSHSRSFKSISALYRDSSDYGGNKVVEKVPVDSSTKQFTVTLSSPSAISAQQILHQLSSFKRDSFEVRHHSAIVILATPFFATWLENSSFISKVLGILVQDSRACDVSTLVAVVDGLPPDPRLGRRFSEGSREGFAFLSGQEEALLPDLWISDHALDYQSRKASLSFNMDKSVTITIPLANTVFRNGRLSTLLASSWHKSPQSKHYERTNHIMKQSQRICLMDAVQSDLKYYIPLTALTPPRRIESGLGNIVRQITGAGNKIVPASQELETSIDAYLESRLQDKRSLAVWALVIPDSIIELDTLQGTRRKLNSTNGVSPDVKHIKDMKYLWEGSGSINDVGLWLLRGAGFHRVLSGGGGWGAKQGLLSLDPEISIEKTSDARYDLGTECSMDNREQTRALGEIAKPGSYIQFLVAHELPKDGSTFRISELSEKSREALQSCGSSRDVFVLGSKPSTIDDMPLPEEMQTPASHKVNHEASKSIHISDGFFGAQSETGFFMEIASDEPDDLLKTQHVSYTKLDVPYSTAYRA